MFSHFGTPCKSIVLFVTILKIQREIFQIFGHISVSQMPFSLPKLTKVKFTVVISLRSTIVFRFVGIHTRRVVWNTLYNVYCTFCVNERTVRMKGVRRPRGVSKCWVEPIFISCFVACSPGSALRKTSITTVCCSVLLMVPSIISFIEEID